MSNVFVNHDVHVFKIRNIFLNWYGRNIRIYLPTYFKVVVSFWMLFFVLEILENTTSFVFRLSAPRISQNILKITSYVDIKRLPV